MQQRESFIDVLFDAAKTDPRIMFLSADFGSPSLDAWRRDLPAQFVHCGISEQNMINVAVGMALAGKRPYVFAMSPFFLRAYEQLKMAAMHQVPITVISVGAGLSYAGSGPTHYATEDIACYRTLVGVQLYTASTNLIARMLAALSLQNQGMMVVRLERGEFPELYPNCFGTDGYALAQSSNDRPPSIACGYLVHRLKELGHNVIDLFRIKPISPQLVSELGEFPYIQTFEEQYAAGGMGAAVMEALADAGKKTLVIRKCLPDRPIYENGTREELVKALLL